MQTDKLLKVFQTVMALAIIVSITMLAAVENPVFAQSGFDLGLTTAGPTYATAGGNITYELVLQNLTDKVITDIGVFDPIPANTTYVSGGDFIAADNGVEFSLASLAAHATHKFTLVVKVNSGVAAGTVIENKNIQIYQYTIPGAKTDWYADGINTIVEAPGMVVASLKNSSNRTFDVKVDGFGFDNYVNSPPRNASDDLGADDLFMMFGSSVCQSGVTAASCVLSGPAKTWAKDQINFMNGGHCDGMSGASLRLFEQKSFKGKTTPANFQSGAANRVPVKFLEILRDDVNRPPTGVYHLS